MIAFSSLNELKRFLIVKPRKNIWAENEEKGKQTNENLKKKTKTGKTKIF